MMTGGAAAENGGAGCMMTSLERLQETHGQRWERVWISLIAVLLALLVGAVVILWAGRDPSWRTVLCGQHLSAAGGEFGEALVSITPLIFTGLSVAFCSRTGLFNIGAEGQFIIGQMGAADSRLYGLPGCLP